MSGATENADGSRKGWKHGKTIVDGKVRLTSVSALELASLCLRRWKFAYQFKLKDPETEATKRGTKLHAEAQRYFMTGEKAFSSQLLAGAHMLPPPGPDLKVEWDLVPDLPDGTSGLSIAKLRVAGIPVTGAIDLLHFRRENYGVPNVEDQVDPEGTIKFIDWKFPGSLDYAKPGHKLVETFQMAGYAIWGFENYPEMERARISHGYMPVKGSPRHATALVTREQCEVTWKRATSVAVAMKHAAAEANPDRVDANLKACGAFGHDCPAKVAGVCTAGTVKPLASLIGRTAAARMVSKSQERQLGVPATTMSTTIQPTSLLAQLKAKKEAAAGAAAASASAPTGAEAVAAERLRLQREEYKAKYPELLTQLTALHNAKLGYPVLAGDLAVAANLLANTAIVDGKCAGTGELAEYECSTTEDLADMVTGAQELAAANAAEQPAIQAEAEAKVEQTFIAPTEQLVIQSLTSPDAPEPTKPAPQVAAKDAPVETPKRGRGRPKKVKGPVTAEAAAEYVESALKVITGDAPADEKIERITDVLAHGYGEPVGDVASVVPGGAPYSLADADRSKAINFYVDVAIDGLQTTSFWPIVHSLLADMNEQSGKSDFRMADKGSPYAFGGWEGILSALIREEPIPPGNYHFAGSFGKIGSTVVEAMRVVVAASGGIFIQGAR